MGPFGAIIAGLSAHVNLLLENQQMRPLADGQILLGREHVSDSSSAPRIVFVPSRVRFGNAEVSPITTVTVNAQGFRSRLRARPVATRHQTFDVHIWGDGEVQSSEDPAVNFDLSVALSDTLLRSVYLMGGRTARSEQGMWPDQDPNGPSLDIMGHYQIITIEFDIPVFDSAVNFVPPNTKLGIQVITYADLPGP
jgi:hypothetical protein